MRMYDIIEKKRDGGALTDQEIAFFVNGYVAGDVPDYQASALLMAIYLRGMDQDETLSLTMRMLHSGDVVDLSTLGGVTVDKHSTGGVGDKTSLAVVPLLAAMDPGHVFVAKMSGRGLGHTGGTLDKLESIPGLSTQVERDDFLRIVREHGGAIISQDTDVIRKETDEVYNRICEDGKFKEVMDVLLEFAEKLRLIVWSMTAEGNKPAETVEKETDLTASELTEQPEVRQKIIRAYVYEREFRRIKALPDFKKLLAWLNENQINLRQFKHKISIVFQNARDGELNLLFTGDAQPEHLKMIAENYDGKLPLYEHYWCIKVPHHGTQGHYFDFSQYEPENMLISNGIHFANSKKESKELRTSPLYGGLFYIPDTHMYCSNCDCCDSYENGCSCKEADVISPAYYKDI